MFKWWDHMYLIFGFWGGQREPKFRNIDKGEKFTKDLISMINVLFSIEVLNFEEKNIFSILNE